MTRDHADPMWLDADAAVSLQELTELSGLAESMLRELVEHGAFHPREQSAATLMFSGRCVVLARRARRLQRDLELDAHAVSVVLRLIEQIEGLEAELRALRARHPR